MESMTLREAAARTSRSITTLRRYIRSGKLRAEKRHGRFGPEYFVTTEDLAAAGLVARDDAPLAAAAAGRPQGLAVARERRPAPRPAAAVEVREGVPITLYQELQLKHEQLLVQYGMIRAGGMRALELQGELESRDREIADLRADVERERSNAREVAGLREALRRSRRDLEARELEIAALEEKVRALEMLTRNAVTTQSIERQFSALREQARRVDELSQASPARPGPQERQAPPADRDH